ncbi:uncharacterized protein LOC126324498 [Schistocerca gregaria]|uniref:uncharacterized protein LOC126324498 n=1 Tax=Schistocerca gregaria TaxID=7010 RepID=UPI00211E2322|nr:uncharacterized protein LOC126324498 [Schistocerca gregaria]
MSDLTLAERAHINEHFANDKRTFDQIILMQKVDGIIYNRDKKEFKKESCKSSPKIIVVTKFKLVFFKRSFLQKLPFIQSEFFFQQLMEIDSEADYLDLRFKNPKRTFEQDYNILNIENTTLVTIKSQNMDAIINAILEIINIITYNADPEYAVFTNSDIINRKLLSLKCQRDPVDVFKYIYWSVSSANRVPANPALTNHIEKLYENNTTELDLFLCPGIKSCGNMIFDLISLGKSLKYNTHFTSIKSENLIHKQIIQALAEAIKYNKTLKKIVVRNSDAFYSSDLSVALRLNIHHQIQILDISGTKFEDSSFLSLTDAIRELKSPMRVLGLANCHLSEKKLLLLIYSFQANWPFSLSLEEIDLSGNYFTGKVSNIFNAWLSKVASYSNLKRIALSNTGIDGLTFFPSIRLHLKLKFLDLSNNDLSNVSQSCIYKDCPGSRYLRVLNLSNTNMDLDVFSNWLYSMAFDESAQSSCIKLENFIRTDNLVKFTGSLSIARNLSTLDLSRNNLSPNSGIQILNALNLNLKKLYLDYNFSANGSRKLILRLVEFITDQVNLEVLSIAGFKGLNKDLDPIRELANALGQNQSLIELNISDNLLKDKIFSIICLGLSTSKIKYINFCKNGLTYNGYLAFRDLVMTNKNITDWELPSIKLENPYEPIWNVCMDIQRLLYNNIGATGAFERRDVFSWYKNWKIPEAPAVFPELPAYFLKISLAGPQNAQKVDQNSSVEDEPDINTGNINENEDASSIPDHDIVDQVTQDNENSLTSSTITHEEDNSVCQKAQAHDEQDVTDRLTQHSDEQSDDDYLIQHSGEQDDVDCTTQYSNERSEYCSTQGDNEKNNIYLTESDSRQNSEGH